MADYTDNALVASIKALEQVVLPAVDPADPLATEQLRLVTGFLKFLRTRLPHGHARHHFELAHGLALAAALAPDAAALGQAEITQRLADARAQGQAVQAQPLAPPDTVQAASAALATAAAAVGRAAAVAEPSLRTRIERHILAGSQRWVEMQRAWFVPQGFDLRPGELPPLEQTLYSQHRASA